MGLNVYFEDDVRDRIVAVTVAALSAHIAGGRVDVAYCRGIVDNCRAVGLSFGLPWSGVEGDLRCELSAVGVADLLDVAGALLSEGR